MSESKRHIRAVRSVVELLGKLDFDGGGGFSTLRADDGGYVARAWWSPYPWEDGATEIVAGCEGSTMVTATEALEQMLLVEVDNRWQGRPETRVKA